MIWNLRFNKELENLLDFKEQGIDVPALREENIPSLRADEDYILAIFFKLSRSRPPAFSGWLAPIPLSEISDCHVRFKLKHFMGLWDFSGWMQMLDQAVIDHFAPPEKKEKKGTKDTL